MKNHVLIIDNDIKELARLRRILAREGFSIQTAENEEMARQIMRKISIDWVICKTAVIPKLKPNTKDQ